MTTWSERLLDVAFVLACAWAAVAVVGNLVDARTMIAMAGGGAAVAGFLAFPGIVRGEHPWWMRRRSKR